MTLSSQEIIDGLSSRKKEVVEYVYKENYKSIYSYIIKNQGNTHDAEDIFHDALIALYNIVLKKEFKLTCAFSTFFFAICKNLWLKELEKRSRVKSKFDQIDYHINYDIKSQKNGYSDIDEYDINEIVITYEKDNLFRFHFEQLKDICKQILLLYFGKTPMKEIAVITGFKSENTVKVKKFYCQEEFIKNIKNDPEYHAIIQKVNLIKQD